jgi:hypothetical protein
MMTRDQVNALISALPDEDFSDFSFSGVSASNWVGIYGYSLEETDS